MLADTVIPAFRYAGNENSQSATKQLWGPTASQQGSGGNIHSKFKVYEP